MSHSIVSAGVENYSKAEKNIDYWEGVHLVPPEERARVKPPSQGWSKGKPPPPPRIFFSRCSQVVFNRL